MRQSFFLVMALLFGAFQSQAQICTRTQLPSNLQNGLVAYYPFCGNANDASGNGNNGTVNGAVLTADRFGVINNAYQFNGTNNYIQTNYSGVGSNTSRSFSLWFKTNQLFTLNPTISGQNEEMDLLSYGGGGTGATIEVSLNHNCQGLSFDVFNGVFTRSAITSDNNWHHLVYVFDNSLGSDFANIKMYLDGVLIQSVKCMGATASTLINTILTNPLVIGSHYGRTIRHFKGTLDDILIFNRPLLSCEVTQLYNSTSSSVPQLGSFGFNPLSDTTRICGKTTTLDAGAGFLSYSWNTGANTRTITATSGGVYSVTTVNGAGCSASDSTLLNLVNANIINNDTAVCLGASVRLSIDSISPAGGSFALYNPGSPNPWPSGSLADKGAIDLGVFGQKNIFSVSFWINPEPIQNGITVILDCSHSGGTNWVLQTTNSGSTWAWSNLQFTLLPNQWQHVLMTYDNGQKKIFVNGQLVASQLQSFSYIGSPRLYLGNWPEGGRRFKGFIDELYITNTILQQNNFTPSFEISSPISNAMGLWKFNEGQGLLTVNSLNSATTQLNNWVWGARQATFSVSWTPGGLTSNSITVTPATTTMYYATVTDGIGTCTDSVRVTVTPPPTAGILSGTQSLCVGSTSTFTSTATGGTWSSSNSSVATINATTGLVTALTAGTATMTYTVPGTGGCLTATATRSVTITAAPNAGTLSGNQALCVGSTAVFTSTATGGTWSSSNSSVATINATTGLVTALTGGTLTMTYAVAGTGGCATATATRAVTVTANPTISALSDTTRVCGTSTVLNAGAGYTSYSWSNGATAQTITVTSGGFYKVTVANAAGCSASDSTFLSLVNANIINNDTTICLGASVRLSIDSVFSGRTSCTASGLPANLRNGLVGYWPFCGNANDASGNGNNGTVSGPTLSSDRFGTSNAAYTFGSGIVTIPHRAYFSIAQGGEFSISLWVRKTGSENPAHIIGKRDQSAHAFNWQIAQHIGAGGVVFSGATGINGNNTGVLSNQALTQNVWQHLVGIYRAGNWKLYRDALLIGETNSLFFQPDLTNSSLQIGNSGGWGAFGGQIDDIMIYNRALTLSEIRQLFSESPTVSWSTGATSNSITVSPTQTTTYTVTVTDGITTCTDNVTVHVSTIDTAVTVLDPTAICSATGGQVRMQANASTGVSYQWLYNGAPAAMPNNIRTYTATQSGSYRVVITNAAGCRDTSRTITINLVQTPSVDAITNRTLCNNGSSTAIPVTGSVAGTTFSWTNSNASIGLAASGTGNIPAFTAVNAGSTPITATITITPTNTVSGLTCTGTPITFTITVNPTPTVSTIANQVVCNGGVISSVSFGGVVTGTIFNWTNNNSSIGLAASGTGNISSFTATNTGSTPVTAAITVTPSYSNSGATCLGTPTSFTITVNPTPTVNPINSMVVCSGASTSPIVLSGSVNGTLYTWSNSNTAIGLAASGTGNITSFSAVNTGTSPVAATITVTPSLTSGGVVCSGTASTFTITVNPSALVNTVSNQSVCNGSTTTAISFGTTNIGGTTTYSWTNNTPSIGLAASGTGNISSFSAINTGSTPVTATISVTPSYTNNGVTCTGTATTFTITVNPTPVATIVNPTTTNICQGSSVTLSATGGASYEWYLNGVLIPGVSSPTYSATQAGAYTVVPISATGCRGQVSNSVTLGLIARPTADFTFDSYCAGFLTNFTNLSTVSGSGVVGYAWSLGIGQPSTLVNPSITYTQAGNYSVTLAVTPLACPTLVATVTKVVNVVPAPVSIRYPTLYAKVNRDQPLSARTFNLATYTWTPAAGLSASTIFNPVFNYDRQQEYSIRIRTSQGCVIVDTQKVLIFNQCDFFVPEAFSPNGDGNNDRLAPKEVCISKLIYFRVYDRWGQLVFETRTSGQGWDGTYKGVKQPIETYAWIVEGLDADGKPIKRSGTSILLR